MPENTYKPRIIFRHGMYFVSSRSLNYMPDTEEGEQKVIHANRIVTELNWQLAQKKWKLSHEQ